ncbi:MAG: endolytic transglycosylase MltG [Candidatus Nanopelagicales bacterium]
MSQLGLTMTNHPESEDPTPGRRRSRVAIWIALVTVFALVAGGAVVAYIFVLKSAPDYPGPGQGEVTVQVSQGQSIPAIADELKAKDVVLSTEAFVDAASGDDRARGIQTGFFKMKEQMTASGALGILSDPANLIQSVVVVPEGATATDIAQAAADATKISVEQFNALIKDPSDLGLPAYARNDVEGYLYPATYDFGPDATATSIFKAMIDKFKSVATEIDLVKRAAAIGQSPHDIVTVASILEKEGYENYFAQISRTIYNRLAAPMRLQLDSTVNYGLGTSQEELTGAQLKQDTPYNTYLHDGLPPTPINSPGQAALVAALDPAPGDWTYFLSIPGTKEMRFTNSYKQFLKDQEDMRAAFDKQSSGQ